MRIFHTTLVAVVAVALGGAGCATKKFVRKTVDPVSVKLGEVEKRTGDAITELGDKTERGIARVDERAGAADARAAEAGRKAGEADRKAGEAGERAALGIEKADGARTLAESGLARTGQLERVVDNHDNFRVASSKTLYFDFAKSELKDQDRKELDELAGALTDARRYVVEVQGFTDATGATDYNYELSAKRAASVVRYLATQHKIPAYRIHTLGLGKDQPVEPNKTVAGRKLNRRVEVRVYMPQAQELAQQTATQ